MIGNNKIRSLAGVVNDPSVPRLALGRTRNLPSPSQRDLYPKLERTIVELHHQCLLSMPFSFIPSL